MKTQLTNQCKNQKMSNKFRKFRKIAQLSIKVINFVQIIFKIG